MTDNVIYCYCSVFFPANLFCCQIKISALYVNNKQNFWTGQASLPKQNRIDPLGLSMMLIMLYGEELNLIVSAEQENPD